MLFHSFAVLKPLLKHVLLFVYLLNPLSLLLSLPVLKNILVQNVSLLPLLRACLLAEVSVTLKEFCHWYLLKQMAPVFHLCPSGRGFWIKK